MKILLIIISLLFVSTMSIGKSLDAHVHGSVNLDIAIDGNEMLIMLETPSESLLGFEYKAKKLKEKDLVSKTKSDWKKIFFHLFQFINNDNCKIRSSSWNQTFSSSSHSKIIAESHIKCSSILKDKKMTIHLKESYHRIKEINLQLLRDDGSIINKKYLTKQFTIKL